MKHQNHTEQWNDSLSGDYLWNNTNFGEAITETMTPMTWSVLQFTLDDWVFLPGFSTVGNIGGSPYINISIFESERGAKEVCNGSGCCPYANINPELNVWRLNCWINRDNYRRR